MLIHIELGSGPYFSGVGLCSVAMLSVLKGRSLQCGTDDLVCILGCWPPLRGDLKAGVHQGHNVLGTVFRRLQPKSHPQMLLHHGFKSC